LLRLLPALWVCLILTVLIGSLFTAFDFSNYIKSSETISYALSNGFLYQADFSLPGVVLTSNAKYGAIVNGSIWTIPIEARLYLIVAMVGAAQLIGIKFGANLATILLIGVGLISPSHLPFIGEYNQNWRIAAFFSAGALLYINRDHVPLDGTIFALLILAAIISHGTPDFEVFAGAAIAYGTLFLAYAPTLPLPSFIEDYSYGLYIYGWPVGQLVAHFLPSLRPKSLFVVTLVFASIIGALSWHLIEKRALRFKSKVLRHRTCVETVRINI
jgi:peptidoglycan/LPS O-acetylase OafA/YrhL